MRYNRLAIDFWLSSDVLPEETKQFPENLKATSWHVAEGTVCGNAFAMLSALSCMTFLCMYWPSINRYPLLLRRVG
jgi:hypothetical protein